ncbi:MAG TPA: transglycosylase domain-containing protein, partial [Pseudonocardiaceae bacterium]|nr:transglycosylase domain-containing protein [Pseudonocardiaceae bacterium]
MRVPVGVARMLLLCALAGVLLAGTMAPVALGAGLLANQVSDSVDSVSASLETAQVPLVTNVEDKNGHVIAQLFDQYRLPVSFNQISPNMVAALVDIEDHRFYQESGIDVQGMVRAALNNSSGGSTQGASTITQQYVKNYLVDVVDRGTTPQAKAAQAADTDQSVVRKLREAKIAVQLDQTMTKNQILTGYLNVVPFGSEAKGPFGIGAAAKAYFNESPGQLTVPQAALLAGMVNNPVLFNPYSHPQQALQRRNLVIDDMVKYRSIPAAQGAQAKAAPLGVIPGGPNIPSSTCYDIQPDAGFFCAYVVQYLEEAGFTKEQINSGGYTIRTTMDPKVATDAKNAVNTWVPTNQHGVANTLVVVQPGAHQHNVLAMVANRNYGLDGGNGETSTNLVANVDDEFGGGSTYKLFTTASAFEQGKAGLNTVLPNPNTATFQIGRRTQPYTVSNNDGTASSLAVWQGLAYSPNTLFVGLEINDGMHNVLTMAYRLGMRHTMLSNQHGSKPVTDPKDSRSSSPLWSETQIKSFNLSPSFTLGVSPLSPLEHANVGATLASGGVWCEPNPVQSVTDRYGKAVPVLRQPCEQVISPAEANTIRNGMSHNIDPGATGAAAAAANNWTIPLSAKTGTTQNSESVGYLAIVDGYAASSLVFADGSRPDKICASQPPRLNRDASCGGAFAFGASVSAPPFYRAFEQILAGVPNAPIPAADPNFLSAQGHGPLVPFVMNEQVAPATRALQDAGYRVSVRSINSAQSKGMVVGQTPQSN